MPDHEGGVCPDVAIATVSSGVPGLDEVLGGGFPRNRITLVTGGPGTGKTTLGLQFLAEGARHGERGLYLALSETADELRAIADSYGICLDGIEVSEIIPAEEAESEAALFQPGEVGASESATRIIESIEAARPRRVVLDFVSALRLLFTDDLHFQQYLLRLKRLAQQGATVLLMEVGIGDEYLRVFANGVVQLQQVSRDYGPTRRRLCVNKVRGAPHATGFHDFRIGPGGLTIFPRVKVLPGSIHRETLPLISTGFPEFDAMLGGGFRIGSNVLFLGASGTGKSALASEVAVAAALRGEPAVIFAIDEQAGNYFDRSRGLGIEIGRALDTGKLRLEQINAAESSPGEFVHKALDAAVRERARVIVIDGIGEYMQAMRHEPTAALHMSDLLSTLSEKRVVTILPLIESGVVGSRVSAPVFMSYLCDTIILFRYFETEGLISKCITVLKKRYGPHESGIHELKLEPGRIRIGPLLHSLRGVMTGNPSSARQHERE
ncbi:MAG: ATPase domain-containing protein [bacterium]|jgi:circadian clock protein KaiC